MFLSLNVYVSLYCLAAASISSALSISHLCNHAETLSQRSLPMALPSLCPPSNHTIQASNLKGSYVSAPFAMFALVDVPIETIDELLQEAFDWSTLLSWLFYLVTGPYTSAPKIDHDRGEYPGTKVPIDKTFQSPFAGKTQMDAAEWLKNKPDDLQLDSYHFAVLDKMAEETGHVAVCRIGKGPPQIDPVPMVPDVGDDEVTCLLKEASDAGLFLAGLEGYDWENLLDAGLGYTPVL